jgi:hypothetical protein
MTNRLVEVLLVCGLGASSSALAQMMGNPAGTTATQAAEVRSSDDMLLRNYSWSTRTELVKDGRILDQFVVQNSYLPSGLLQSTEIGVPYGMPTGFTNPAVSADTRAYLVALKAFVQTYRPTAGALLNFISAAHVTGPNAQGALVAQGQGLIVNGDLVTIWLDATTKQLRREQVTTTFQSNAALGDPVQMISTFAPIPNGPTHMEYVQVTLPAMKAYVLIHNYNYTKVSNSP